jgi:tRNA nucleotidyltransferase (CCA-adding enzyme)
MNLFERLSGPRLYEELLLLFRETEPNKTLKRLSDFGLLKVIYPTLAFNEELDTTMKSMYETFSWFNLLFLEEKTDRGILFLMAMLTGLKDEEVKDAVERLSPPPKIKDLIIRGIPLAREVLKKLPLDEPVETYNLLSKLKLETILLAMATSKERLKQKVISQYLTELRKAKTILSGEDLKQMGIKPGPLYSRILKELLDERLRGHLKSREDEERFVRSLSIKLAEKQRI